MKTKEQIIEWLKSHALYDAFAKNISPITVEDEVERRTSRGESSRIINSAFHWLNSDEGPVFWSNANKEFFRWLESDEQTEQSTEDEQTEQSSDRWIFDRGSKEAPFYVVYAGGKALTHRYALMEEATKEADRLAKLLNTKTYVLAAVMEIRPEIVTSAVGIDDMEHQVDNPF